MDQVGICEDCNEPSNGGLIKTEACADCLGCCYKMVCANGCKLICPECQGVVYGYRMDFYLAECIYCKTIFNVPHLKWWGMSIQENNRRYDNDQSPEEDYAIPTHKKCIGCKNINLTIPPNEFCTYCLSIKICLYLQKKGLPFDIIQMVMKHLNWFVLVPTRKS